MSIITTRRAVCSNCGEEKFLGKSDSHHSGDFNWEKLRGYLEDSDWRTLAGLWFCNDCAPAVQVVGIKENLL